MLGRYFDALLCPHLQYASPRGGVCVCAPCNHRDPFGFFFSAGVVARQRVYHQRRHSLSLGDTGTDHPSVPATIFKVCGHARYAVNCRFVFDLSFWPLLRLKTSRLLGVFLDLSGFGFLRLACGTAVKSVRISISVFMQLLGERAHVCLWFSQYMYREQVCVYGHVSKPVALVHHVA